jgi:arylsulfatase A-like enzyme
MVRARIPSILGCLLMATATFGDERPNILWITCEDISPNLGCYGDAFATTPTLDRLAERGVRMTNAYGICGVCAVNRSCIITGNYSSTIGSQNMRSDIWLPGDIRCFSALMRDAGYYCTNKGKTDYNFPVPDEAWDAGGGKAHWRNRNPGQPFFSVVNFTVTHESKNWFTGKAHIKLTDRVTEEQRHDPAEVSLPPFHPDTPEMRMNWANYYDNITQMDYQVADVLAELAEDGLTENTIVFFYSDHGIGMPACKQWIGTWGIRVPMIICVPDKYKRWALGPGGSVCDRMVSFVDLAPTILSLGGAHIPETMEGHAFMGDAAAKPREYVYGIRNRHGEGEQLLRFVRDREFQYIRNFRPELRQASVDSSWALKMQGFRSWIALWKARELNEVQSQFFRIPRPTEELYDTQADPHQIHNLADDPQYADVKARLRRECFNWIKRSGDLGFLPEHEMHRRAIEAECSPYEIGQDPKRNPVEALVDAADMASQMDPANLPKLTRLLDDEDIALQCWGMFGLRMLDVTRFDTDVVEKIRRVTIDPERSIIVRIPGAEILIRLGETEVGLPVLAKGLENESTFARLNAICVCARIGKATRPLVPVMKTAKRFPRWINPGAQLIETLPLRLEQED